MIILLISLTASALLDSIDRVRSPETYISTVEMTNHISKNTSITYKFRIKYKKDAGTLIKVLSPKMESGRKMLIKDRNIWLYSPEINRTIRLSLRDRFFGSEFTNGDLLIEFRENYIAESLKTMDNLYLLSIVAKTEDAPYSRIEMSVDRKTFIPLSMKLYSLSGRLLRKMVFSDVKSIRGYRIPMYMKVTSTVNPDRYTEMKILEFKPDVPLNIRIFRPWRLN